MIPLYEVGGGAQKPFGTPMCQNRLAVPTWSYAMELRPPKRIIELGSYNGALAIALGLHAYHIGCQVTTYERSKSPSIEYEALAKFLGVTFRDGIDMWSCEAEIGDLVASPGVTFLLCDGGDKPRELAAFARFLKPDDVIAAHDYSARHIPDLPDAPHPWPWSETKKEDGDRVAAAHGLVPWMQSYFDHAGWLVYERPGP